MVKVLGSPNLHLNLKCVGVAPLTPVLFEGQRHIVSSSALLRRQSPESKEGDVGSATA